MSNHGGRRLGAGRKPLEEPRSSHGFRASKSERAEIDRRFADELGMSLSQALQAYARGEWTAVKKK